MPFLPLTLTLGSTALTVQALLDTGAAANVMPLEIGLQLGAEWQPDAPPITLAGALGGVESQGLLVTAQVATFPLIALTFAWARTNQIRLILGQENFFQEFDAYFARSRDFFEISPKAIRARE